MYNKKALSKATAELDKAKAPAKPKDIITDPMGQWKYPGLPTRIPGNDITMKGVGYPVIGVADTGQRQIMLPGADYTFPGADYVDEYPQMQSGGTNIPTIEDAGSYNEENIWVPDWNLIKEQAKKLGAKTVRTQSGVIIQFDSNWNPKTADDNPQMRKGGPKKKTKSLSGTNKLLEVNELFKNYKNRRFDPKSKHFQDGGEKYKTNYGPEDKQEEHVKSKWVEPNYQHDSDGTYYDPITQTIHIAPEHKNDKAKIEHEKMHHWQNLHGALRDSSSTPVMKKPHFLEDQNFEGDHYYDRRDKESEYTKQDYLNAYPEAKFMPDQLLNDKVIDPAMYNNPYSVEGEGRDYENYIESGGNSIFEQGGEYIEADLTEDEIDQYRKGGFIVEDISVPELNQAKKGKSVNTSKSPRPSVYTAKNDKDYAFRKKAYDDSLSMYNLSTLNNMLANNYEKDPDVSEKEQMDYAKKNDAYIQKMKKIKSQALTKFGDVYGKQTKPAQTIIKPYKSEVEPIDFKSSNKKSVEKTKKIPNIETRNSVNSYEDSLTAYNNYVQRKDILANLKKDQFESKKELDEFLNKENLKYPTNPSLAAKTKSIKKQFVYPKGESIISLEDYIKPKGSQTSKPKDVIVDKPNNTAKPVKVNNAQYPQGYQPYSLYGKVLDPEVYGYAESLNGKPVQVSQFADTYGHKAKMDAYKKSGQYPWKKQKGGTKDKFATHIGDDGTVGTTSVHTDKKGNITTKVQDSKGITHYKVKTKDGKVFYKQDASTAYPENNSISPEHYKIDPRQIEMNDGALQPVDDVWTLPIGMTSAGVKGTVGLAKGLGSLASNVGKSSLVQAGKTGTKALFKAAPKWAPGMNLGNAIGSGFAGSALTDVVTGKVAEPWKKANKSGKGSDYVDAVTENMFTALDAIPAYGAGSKGLKQLGKYATTQAPLKNAYKALPQASASKNKIPGLPRVASFVNGLNHGIDDIIKGRKFSETFPITKKQKAKIEYLQDQAHKEGLEFMDDYLYRIYDGVPHYGEIHPDVRSKIDKITDLEDPTLDAFKRKFDNTHNLIGPYGNAEHHLANANEKELVEALNNGTLDAETVDYIRRNKHKMSGVNMHPKSITLRNKGVYYESPESIRNVTVHEAGHSMQELGYGSNTIGNSLSIYDPKYPYYIANENTKFGKEFRNAQVFPKEKQYLWEASPLEVHSEAMSAKDKIYREFVKKGMSKMDALRYLRNPDNALADEIIKEGSLNRFFKHVTTNDQKRKLIKMLPAIIPAGAVVNYIPKPQKSKQMKEGGMITQLTPKEIQEYINQGYIVEEH